MSKQIVWFPVPRDAKHKDLVDNFAYGAGPSFDKKDCEKTIANDGGWRVTHRAQAFVMKPASSADLKRLDPKASND